MRTYVLTAMLLLFAMSLAAQMNVAFVNVDSLLANCAKCKEAEAQYQAEVTQWEAELTAMSAELDSLKAQLEMPLSDAKKKELQQLSETKSAAFEARRNELFGQDGLAMKLNYQLIMPLLDHIQASMEAYASQQNIQIIFDGDSGEILYMASGSEPVDATGNILEFVNKQDAAEKE